MGLGVIILTEMDEQFPYAFYGREKLTPNRIII